MLNLRRVVAFGMVGITLVLASATQVLAFDTSSMRPHITLNIASHHLNASDTFEESNPGIGVGFTVPVDEQGSEFGLEVGQYRNSIRSNSVYVMGSLDTPVASLSSAADLRLGVFGGVARYPGATKKFKSGVPTMGDWVLAAGGQATVRIREDYDVRMRVLPAGNVADALFTLQVAYRF